MSTAVASVGSGEHVVVVDDDRSVRRALGRILTSVGYRVTLFESAEACLESGPPCDAGCLIVDQKMPGLDGLDLQKRLAGEGVNVPIVFLSGQSDVPTSVRAMKDGAIDFLTKPVESDRLLEVVSRALQDGAARRVRDTELESIRRRAAQLTPRERQVMDRVARGMLNKQIGYDLGTSEKTVKVHRARVMEKLCVSSVAELVRLVDQLDDSASR